jgi:hypothetical protein
MQLSNVPRGKLSLTCPSGAPPYCIDYFRVGAVKKKQQVVDRQQNQYCEMQQPA